MADKDLEVNNLEVNNSSVSEDLVACSSCGSVKPKYRCPQCHKRSCRCVQ